MGCSVMDQELYLGVTGGEGFQTLESETPTY
jgi:hypothetical protein